MGDDFLPDQDYSDFRNRLIFLAEEYPQTLCSEEFWDNTKDPILDNVSQANPDRVSFYLEKNPYVRKGLLPKGGSAELMLIFLQSFLEELVVLKLT